MAETKMNMLYYMVINGIILNDKNMFGRGISRKDMSEMLSFGMIEKINDDEYRFMDVDGLYQYGIKLLGLRRKKEAYECFCKCYELRPDDVNMKLHYLLNLIKENEYQLAFKICEELSLINDSVLRSDINTYMNLFSVFFDLEPSQVFKVKTLRYKDITLEYNDENMEENEVRKTRVPKLGTLVSVRQKIAILKRRESLFYVQEEKSMRKS